MYLVYLLGIYAYQLLINLVAPFNKKAMLLKNGRANWKNTQIALKGNNSQTLAWFHCASLGEFEQARPVLEKYKTLHPEHKILLSFFSPSGYEIRKNYPHADYIVYLPADTSSNAAQFIAIWKPSIAYFVKYEFWHHYTLELKKNNIPLVSFSSIFRENQVYFKLYGGFFGAILKRFSMHFVQDELSAQLLKSIGIENVKMAGDTRFDRVIEICKQAKEIELARLFTQNNENTLVIGSAWHQDMEVLLPIINNETIQLKYIIAPHEIHENEIQELISKITSGKAIRYSQATSENVLDAKVLIIDNIGMLSSLYKYGTIAYIGGAFGKGLHNILEAATYGMPIIFGPKYTKFNEAKELIAAGGAFSINNTQEAQSRLVNFLLNKEVLVHTSQISYNYVIQKGGATEVILG